MDEKGEIEKEIPKCNPKCIHEFVTDLIDIDPDRSQMIQYCIKCHIIE
jgi:hypothetical protein